MEIYEKLPEPYKDAIYTTVEVHLSFVDKLRILFGASLTVNIQNLVENAPGRHEGNAETQIGRILPKLRRKTMAYEATT